jgi:hypothetical protein
MVAVGLNGVPALHQQEVVILRLVVAVVVAVRDQVGHYPVLLVALELLLLN